MGGGRWAMWSLRQQRLVDLIPGEALSVGSQQPAAPCSAGGCERVSFLIKLRWSHQKSTEAHGSPKRPGLASGARREEIKTGPGVQKATQPRQPWRGAPHSYRMGWAGGGDQARSRELEGMVVVGGCWREWLEGMPGSCPATGTPGRFPAGLTETPRGWGGGTTAPGGGLRAETMQTVAPKGLMEKPGA